METKTIIANWEKNFNRLVEKDLRAKKNKILTERYIQVNIADGFAYYEIIKENKKTVRIKIVTGIGDDYRVGYWGDMATIDKNYALENIAYRDNLYKIFDKK